MLRVGVMLESYVSSAWVAKVIEDIQSSGFARVELVILNPLARKNRGFSLFQFYERWDYQRNKVADDAMAPTDVSYLLNGVPSLFPHLNREGVPGNILEQESAAIRNHRLDVLFHFGLDALGGDILGATRYGVWSFHFGNDSEQANQAPLWKELYEKNPVSSSSLQIRTDSPGGTQVIYRSYAATDLTSLYLTRNPIYWKTAEFALRCLHDLHRRGFESLKSRSANSEESRSTSRVRSAPNSFQMAHFMARHLSRGLQARIAAQRLANRVKWYLAIRPKTTTRRFDDPSGYRLMPSANDRFYADPFMTVKDGKTYLFFEDFRYADDRALISCCELGPDGTVGVPVEALRRPYHLSYPFLLEERGEMYMIPETRGNRTLELYRATSFPTTWLPQAVLLTDVDVVDATIQKINGKLWMFAGISNGKFSTCDELGLFFADALQGPWTPHPCNPVLSDVRRARPAGALFYEEGRLIRPSQDCSKDYGYALVFSEIATLSETEYEERPIGRMDPCVAQGHTGTHTYTRTEQFEIVDRKLPPKYAR
jgi:hypothetical protein